MNLFRSTTNCFLCHADSQSRADVGRAAVPRWDEEVPPQYYHARDFAMVRADVTYLRQDFSVLQNVHYAEPWPASQRFDYVVRKTPIASDKAAQVFRDSGVMNLEYREVIGEALSQLTGVRAGENSHEAWAKALKVN